MIEKNSDLKYKITLTNSAEYGVIDQLEFFDHKISNGDNIRNYYVVRNGDFVYNPRISVTAPVGPINQSQLGYTGVMSPLYYVFRIHDIDAEYLRYFFKTNLWHPYLKGNGNSGARFDRLSITDELFVRMPISLPVERKEQRAIATYFRHIDSLIETADKKVASLKQVKEASLQSMFPKEGQKVPEVRFKGFEGEWKIDELGNLFTERVESDVYAEMLSVTLSQGIIKAKENGRYDNSNSDKSKYRLVKVGDIAYNSMRMWQGASGYSPYYGIVSPAYTVVVPNNNVDSCFFAYMFKTAIMIKQFRLNSQGLTTDTWNLKFPAFSKIDVTYPADTAEQRKIASFFVHLDKQIAIAQQRLDLLRRIKSACLDEMFV